MFSRRAVDEVDHSGAEGVAADQLQRYLDAVILEQALPGAHDDGVDQQVELVDEASAQQRPGEGGAAGDEDGVPGLVLELGDLLDHVASEQGGVLRWLNAHWH